MFTFGVAFLIACGVAIVAGPLLALGGGGKVFRMAIVALMLTIAHYAYDKLKRSNAVESPHTRQYQH